MLDFETPTYITAKESQQMQSGVSSTKTHHTANIHQAVKNKLCPQMCPAFCYPKVVDDGNFIDMWSLKFFHLRNLMIRL